MVAYPHEARRTRSRPAGLAAIAGVALVGAAALAGWVVGDRPAAAPASGDSGRTVALGGATVRVPAEWNPTRAPGAFAPVAGLPARAQLALVDPVRLPARFGLPALRQMAPGRRTVVAGLPAWTYAAVHAAGRRHELTVVPTTAGLLGIACSAPSWAWSAALGCEGALEEIGAGALRPPPASAAVVFRLALPAHLGMLDRRRVADRRALRRAATPAARAGAAARLADAHRAAAAALAPLATDDASRAVITALRAHAGAYRALAGAAEPRAYRRAARRVDRTDAALRAVT